MITVKKKGSFEYLLSAENVSYPVWYKGSPEPPDMDYALAGAIFPAMKMGQPIRIEGPVSETLMRGVDKIQDIFKVWYPDLKKIQVEAEIKVPRAKARGVATFFTAGVDSFYTFLKHIDEITHFIYVLGFDIKLEEREFFEKVQKALIEVSAEYGKKVIFLETNLRDLLDPYLWWGASHGCALASAAHVLKNEIGKIYIPSSHSYRDLFAWGSHPLSDPLWSSDDIEIAHDGCEAKRFEKVMEIARHKAALRHLRVCWSNPKEGSYNCGRCEKCMRTMATLRILGVLNDCKTFDRPLDLAKLRRVKHDTNSRSFHVEIIEGLKKHAAHDVDLADALEDAESGLYHTGIKGWGRRGVKLLRRTLRAGVKR